MRRLSILLAALPALSACASRPPPNWAQGGAPTLLPRAHWQREDAPVDLMPDGTVLVDGDRWLRVDGAGRVYDSEGEPFAVLEPSGELLGTEDSSLGSVDIYTSSLPGTRRPWVTVAQGGVVVHYDEDGDPHADGTWTGCGPAARTCTLVSHLVYIIEARRRPHFGIGIGVGVGVGVGR